MVFGNLAALFQQNNASSGFDEMQSNRRVQEVRDRGGGYASTAPLTAGGTAGAGAAATAPVDISNPAVITSKAPSLPLAAAERETTVPGAFTPDAQSLTQKDVDSLLAKELQTMSFQEREQCMEEMHGIIPEAFIVERPEQVELYLQQFQQELEKTIGGGRQQRQALTGFEKAIASQSTLVDPTNKSFRLQFLRAERWHVARAVRRMTKFFDFLDIIHSTTHTHRKFELPTLQDLTAQELEILKEGSVQLLPARDAVGRRVLSRLDHFGIGAPPNSVLRVMLYFFLACAEDEDTQKKGLVMLYYSSKTLKSKYASTNGKHPPHFYKLAGLLMESMPLRISSFQFCLPDDVAARFFNPIVMIALGTERRVRSRIHTGSLTECLYGLRTLGLPTEEIPLTSTGDGIKLKNHERWLQMQSAKEQAAAAGAVVASSNNKDSSGTVKTTTTTTTTMTTQFPGVICPKNEDVLLGKGTVISRHPGNVRMRQILESFSNQYDSSERRKDKTSLTWEIWTEITKSGARFLKEDPQRGWWVEVDEATARRKIVVGMRDLKTRQQSSKMQTSRSSTSAFTDLDHRKRRKLNAACFGAGEGCI